MVFSEAIYLANLLASASESAEWMAQSAEPVMAGRPQPAAQKLNVNMVYYTWEILVYSINHTNKTEILSLTDGIVACNSGLNSIIVY